MGHTLEGLLELLLAEGQLALCPDFSVLRGKQKVKLARSPTSHIAHPANHADHFRGYAPSTLIHTGLRVFLISVSRVPAFSAMISGAASGSWAMGEPHSEQKMRWTALPELPLPAQLLVGPRMVSLALGTTATRAGCESAIVESQTDRKGEGCCTVG